MWQCLKSFKDQSQFSLMLVLVWPCSVWVSLIFLLCSFLLFISLTTLIHSHRRNRTESSVYFKIFGGPVMGWTIRHVGSRIRHHIIEVVVVERHSSCSLIVVVVPNIKWKLIGVYIHLHLTCDIIIEWN